MKNARRFLLTASLFLPTLAACSSTTETPSGGMGGNSACSDVSIASHAAPPAPGSAGAPAGTAHTTFAIRTILLGNTDRSGKNDPEHAWQKYGFDLDGKISRDCPPATLAGLCRPRNDADPSIIALDGDDGIDNAFGKSVLPILLGLSGDLPDRVANDLAQGGATILVDIEGLGTGADVRPLKARLYDGAPLGKAPAYDGTDAWPVWPGSLTDPSDPASAKLQTADSYVAGDTWVGQFHGVLTLRLPIRSDNVLRIAIHDPTLTMHLDPARKSADGGTLAGVVATEDAVAETNEALRRADPADLCGGEVVMSIATQVAQASDILLDRTQDPAKDCNAVSLGVGFTAARVQLGAVTTPEEIPPLPDCPDGGAPDGG